MKNEKVYSLFMRMYNSLSVSEQEFIMRHIAEYSHGAPEYDNYFSGDFKLVFAECFRVVTSECNSERDRKNKSIPLAFIKSVISECKSSKFAPYVTNGKFYVSSESRGFEFSDIPTSIKYDASCNFNLKALIDDVSSHGKQQMELPNVNEFLSMVDIAKKSVSTKTFKVWYNSAFCFGMNMPSIQIKYLYEVLKHLNNPKIYMTWAVRSPRVKLSPMYIDFDGGRGVIMPIKCDRDERGCTHVN